MKNEIKEITEIITILQDCGRKRISRTEGVIVENKDIATALYEAGYRKQSETVKEFAEKACNRMDNYGVPLAIKQIQGEIRSVAKEFGEEE